MMDFIDKNKLGKSLIKYVIYAWLFLFILLPLLLVLKTSFSIPDATLPPYKPITNVDTPYLLKIELFWKNYVDIIKHDLYSYVILMSLKTSALCTFFAFIIGYAFAYCIVLTDKKYRTLLLLLVMLPFFTSFLMRVYAWMGLLSNYGIVNNILVWLNIITEPITFLGNNYAVYMGIIYCYLPFMVLPIYSSLDRIDYEYLEAAYDLGAKPWQAFLKVTFPLSMPGVVTGCTLVFIPVLGEFVIPELLGSAKTLTLGRAIFLEFFVSHNWPMTCTMTIITLIILVVPLLIFQHYHVERQQKRQNNEA